MIIKLLRFVKPWSGLVSQVTPPFAVQSPPALPGFPAPLSDAHIGKEVTPVEGQRPGDRLRVPGPRESRPGRPDLRLEPSSIKLDLEPRIHPVSPFFEHDPLRSPQDSPQLVQRHMERVLQLGRRGAGPAIAADLIARAPGRMTEEVEQ